MTAPALDLMEAIGLYLYLDASRDAWDRLVALSDADRAAFPDRWAHTVQEPA